MEYKAIKCSNCGAKLNTKPDEEGFVTCKYCRSTFHVETDYKKAYDTTKGTLDAQRDHLNEMGFGDIQKRITDSRKIGKIIGIVFVLIFVTAVVFIITTVIKSDKEFDVDSFNMFYESKVGTKDYFTVYSLIDDVVTNNKTNKRTIKFCLDEICTEESNKAIAFKEQIDKHKDYEVILDYDKDGYVNVVNVLSKK